MQLMPPRLKGVAASGYQRLTHTDLLTPTPEITRLLGSEYLVADGGGLTGMRDGLCRVLTPALAPRRAWMDGLWAHPARRRTLVIATGIEMIPSAKPRTMLMAGDGKLPVYAHAWQRPPAQPFTKRVRARPFCVFPRQKVNSPPATIKAAPMATWCVPFAKRSKFR